MARSQKDSASDHAVPSDFDPPFSLSEQTVRSGDTDHTVWVLTPKRALVFGREHIARFRSCPPLNQVDRWMIDEARRRGHRAHTAVLQAVDTRARRCWSFHPALDEEECVELGYQMSRALLPLHRGLLVAGIALFLHTDWGQRECHAFHEGIRRLAEELETAPKRDAVHEADRWVLRHMLFHFALPLDHIVQSILPGHLRMVDQRWSRLQEMVSRLEAASGDDRP